MPKTYSREREDFIGVPVTREMKHVVRTLAEEQDRSIAAWVRRLIEREVARVERLEMKRMVVNNAEDAEY